MGEGKSGTEIKYAIELLDGGKLVGIPTETVYGLAANGLDPYAVVKIFEAKNRPHFDPLILHIGLVAQLQELAINIPDAAYLLAEKFWPGPLTILLKKSDLVPDIVTAGMDSVGIRMPQHPMALELLRAVNYPLAAPSANPFGYISPTTAEHVLKQLGEVVPYVLDGGSCIVGVESTIVDLTKGQPILRRLGAISANELTEILGRQVSEDFRGGSNPASPGLQDNHYAPRKPLYFGDIEALLDEHGTKDFAILGFRETFGYPGIALSPAGNVAEAAQKLFDALRRLDDGKHTLILAEPLPHLGIGRAVNDRLKRAARKI